MDERCRKDGQTMNAVGLPPEIMDALERKPLDYTAPFLERYFRIKDSLYNLGKTSDLAVLLEQVFALGKSDGGTGRREKLPQTPAYVYNVIQDISIEFAEELTPAQKGRLSRAACIVARSRYVESWNEVSENVFMEEHGAGKKTLEMIRFAQEKYNADEESYIRKYGQFLGAFESAKTDQPRKDVQCREDI